MKMQFSNYFLEGFILGHKLSASRRMVLLKFDWIHNALLIKLYSIFRYVIKKETLGFSAVGLLTFL